MKPLHQQIKNVRKYRKLSQTEFAARLKTCQSRVCQIENPKYEDKITLTSLRKIADVLDCKLEITLKPRIRLTPTNE